MANYYKLNEEIKQFIIEQKKADPKLSCRGLMPLIKERFQVDLSKSLINSVIKENSLSSPRGRTKVREEPVLEQVPETEIAIEETGFMENGGCFFLKAADLKLYLTYNLAKNLLPYFPGLYRVDLQSIIEALIYVPLFKDLKSLSLLIGKGISQERLTKYSQQLMKIPLLKLRETLVESEISHNINEINELYKQCLLRLNSYVLNFFPPEYQFLDFRAMQERFYSLMAKIERRPGFLGVQLFYKPGFFWVNDVIWQEGFSYATNKINRSEIFTKDAEQIWLNPHPVVLDENASSTV